MALLNAHPSRYVVQMVLLCCPSEIGLQWFQLLHLSVCSAPFHWCVWLCFPLHCLPATLVWYAHTLTGLWVWVQIAPILNQKYNLLITSLELSEVSKLTLAYITGRLLEEEARHQEGRLTSAQVWNHSRIEGVRGVSNNGGWDDARKQCTDLEQVALKVRRCYCCGSVVFRGEIVPRGETEGGKPLQNSVQRQKTTLIVTAVAAERGVWILDSGASQNFCQCKSLVHYICPSWLQHVSLAAGQNSEVECEGSADFSSLKHTFTSVLCVPTLENNLL